MRGAWLKYVGRGACLKRVRLDELLRGDCSYIVLGGLSPLVWWLLLFWAEATAAQRQKTFKHTHTHTFNKHTQPTRVVCVCALLSVFVCGSIAACPLQPPHSINNAPTNAQTKTNTFNNTTTQHLNHVKLNISEPGRTRGGASTRGRSSGRMVWGLARVQGPAPGAASGAPG